MKPLIAAAANKYNGKIKFEIINVDKKQELAQEYDIKSIPTIIYLNAEGKIISKSIGYIPTEELDQHLSEILQIKNLWQKLMK